MKIYDSSRREKVDFEPIESGKVTMYVCGPTVYDDIHIGNARTFLSFDAIRRWFLASGYDVRFAQNLTDVDDKIINRAIERGAQADEVARTYADAFIDVSHQFGILDPDIRPRATQEVDGMIEMISRLIETGHAYESEGDVYFSVRSDPAYGHVSNRNIDDLRAGERVEVGEQKRDPLDFALWKAAKPGEPTWDSPWGPGRPGWHTECSAMVHKYLGMPIDIHGGGGDLMFPHHENESAQAECCWEKEFARHWMHTGMLRVNGEKMSKSLGNFYTLKEVLERNSPQALRLLMLQTHYRSPLDFSFDRLDGAEAAYERICNSLSNLDWAAGKPCEEGADTDGLLALCEALRNDFSACMDDDFNTAGALAALFGFVTDANTRIDEGNARGIGARKAAETLRWALGVLGIEAVRRSELPVELVGLAHEVAGYEGDDPEAAAKAIISVRAEARAAKDWSRADSIRDALAGLGLSVEDTNDGARIRPMQQKEH